MRATKLGGAAICVLTALVVALACSAETTDVLRIGILTNLHDQWSGYSEIDGIHYVTFVALLDMTWGKPLTWAFLTLDPEARTITIDGVGEQPDLMLDY